MKNPIDEFLRLIKINHNVSDIAHNVINDVYEKGIEMGKLHTLVGIIDYNSLPQVKTFNSTKLFNNAVSTINPVRKSNIRKKMHYDGPEITSVAVLASDYKVNKVLQLMASKNSTTDYMGFNRAIFDEQKHQERLSIHEISSEYADAITETYNTREVFILLVKCYQVGFSEGTNMVSELPYGIKMIFGSMKDLDAYHAGDRKWIKNEQQAIDEQKFLDNKKAQHPDWEQYSKYYITN